jgi:hypothetical protein
MDMSWKITGGRRLCRRILFEWDALAVLMIHGSSAASSCRYFIYIMIDGEVTSNRDRGRSWLLQQILFTSHDFMHV